MTCSALSFNHPRFARTFNSLLIHPVSSASRPPELRALSSPNISNRTSNLLKTYLSDLQERLPGSEELQPPQRGERIIKIVLLLWEIFPPAVQLPVIRQVAVEHWAAPSCDRVCVPKASLRFQSRRGQTSHFSHAFIIRQTSTEPPAAPFPSNHTNNRTSRNSIWFTKAAHFLWANMHNRLPDSVWPGYNGTLIISAPLSVQNGRCSNGPSRQFCTL